MKYCLTTKDNKIVREIEPCTGNELTGHGIAIFNSEDRMMLENIASSFIKAKKNLDLPTIEVVERIRKHYTAKEFLIAKELVRQYYGADICCLSALEQFITNLTTE